MFSLVLPDTGRFQLRTHLYGYEPQTWTIRATTGQVDSIVFILQRKLPSGFR